MEFKERIKLIRGKLSQLEFAARIGVHYTTVQAYENGKIPKGEILKKICYEFGVNGEWLLNGKGSTYTLDVQSLKIGVTPDKATEKLIDRPLGVSGENISGLVARTIDVLQSGTVYGQALAQNIEAFHQAVTHEVESKKQSRPLVSETVVPECAEQKTDRKAG